MRLLAIAGLGAATLLAGCAGVKQRPEPPVAVHKKIIEPTYDWASPPKLDTNEPTDPKWVPPKYAKVWIKGGVDEEGNAHSGKYVWTCIKPGHWESEEEAELEPRRLLVKGEQVVPNPGSGERGLEVDYDRMQKRLREVETKVGGMELTSEQKRVLAGLSAASTVPTDDLPRGAVGFEQKTGIRARDAAGRRAGTPIRAVDPEDDHPLPKRTTLGTVRVPIQPAGAMERVRLPDGRVAKVLFGADDVTVELGGKTTTTPIDAGRAKSVLIRLE